MALSLEGRPVPGSVGAFEYDRSPYGMRDVSGCSSDWMCDVFQATGPELSGARVLAVSQPYAGGDEGRAARGGSWAKQPNRCRVAARARVMPLNGYPDLSFRLARRIEADERSQ